MSQKIIGLDIGAYSVKALLLDPRKRGAILQLLELRLPQDPVAPLAPAPAPPAPTAAGQEEAELLDDDALLDDDPDALPPLEGGEPTMAPALLAPAWARAAGELLGGLRADGDIIGAPLPGQQAATLHLPSPFPERNKLAKILPGLLMDRMPLPMDEVIHDFTMRPDGKGGHVAVVGFARITDIAAFVAALQEQGLDPSAVAIPELVMEQAARALLPAQGTTALLDMGHSGARLIVWHEGRAALSRTIHVGGQHLSAKIAEVFQASEEDAERVKLAHAAIVPPAAPGVEEDPSRVALSRALVEGLVPLVRDLRRSLQSLYAKDRVEVSKLVLTGGSSRITGIAAHLSDALGIQVELLSPDSFEQPEGMEVDPIARGAIAQRGAMALGMTLSLYSSSARAQSVNLRRGKLAFRGSSPFLRAQRVRIIAAAAVLGVLFLLAMMMQYKDRAAQRDAMRAAVITESKKLFGQPVYSKKDVLKRMEGNTATQTSVAPKMSAYQLLFELTDKVAPDTKLEVSRMEVDVTRSLVQIYGNTDEPQTVDKIVGELEGVKCLKDIKKDKLQVKGEGDVSFELQINSGGCS
jgi:general secretion pathway protein L